MKKCILQHVLLAICLVSIFVSFLVYLPGSGVAQIEADEFEDDDTSDDATTFPMGETQSRTLDTLDDIDWVKFTLDNTELVSIRITVNDTATNQYSYYWSYSSCSSLKAILSDSQMDPVEELAFDDYGCEQEIGMDLCLESGTYYLKIFSDEEQTYSSDDSIEYTLKISSSTPEDILTAPAELDPGAEWGLEYQMSNDNALADALKEASREMEAGFEDDLDLSMEDVQVDMSADAGAWATISILDATSSEYTVSGRFGMRANEKASVSARVELPKEGTYDENTDPDNLETTMKDVRISLESEIFTVVDVTLVLETEDLSIKSMDISNSVDGMIGLSGKNVPSAETIEDIATLMEEWSEIDDDDEYNYDDDEYNYDDDDDEYYYGDEEYATRSGETIQLSYDSYSMQMTGDFWMEQSISFSPSLSWLQFPLCEGSMWTAASTVTMSQQAGGSIDKNTFPSPFERLLRDNMDVTFPINIDDELPDDFSETIREDMEVFVKCQDVSTATDQDGNVISVYSIFMNDYMYPDDESEVSLYYSPDVFIAGMDLSGMVSDETFKGALPQKASLIHAIDSRANIDQISNDAEHVGQADSDDDSLIPFSFVAAPAMAVTLVVVVLGIWRKRKDRR